MTRQDAIKKIRKACEKKSFEEMSWYPQVVRLGDVFCALHESKKHRGVLIDSDGLFTYLDTEGKIASEVFLGDAKTPRWVFEKDDIEYQSDVTVEWIATMV